MRYVLAAIFVCALGLPAASALPAAGPDALALKKASPMVEVAKKQKASKGKRRSSGGGAGGIHPLVGSGDY
jgi:hypothetical protein